MKVKPFELIAFLIFIFGILAILFLTASMAVDLIEPLDFIGGLVLTGIILWQDALWIDRHFVNGEWV